MAERLFPLHLTPFERFMLLDDRLHFPMTFIVQLELSGNLVRSELENGLQFALERHPLLRAIIRRAKQKRECWVSSEQRRTSIDWGAIDEPIQFDSGEFIDLRQEPGLRIWVRHDEKRTVLTAQFHHVCCDGIGSYQFLGDMLWHYANATGAQLPPLPNLVAADLRKRAVASYDPNRFKLANGRFRSELPEVRRLFLSPINPVEQPSASKVNGQAMSFPGIHSHEFCKDDYKKLRLAAQSVGQTPNEALSEGLLIALRDWNREFGSKRQTLVLMVPMDLREPDGPRLSAANCVTYALIKRSGRVLEDRAMLGDSLSEELSQLKRNRHSTRFMNLVASGDRHPWIRYVMVRSSKCLASAILSNTGDPTRSFHTQFPREDGLVRCGNMSIATISGVPPIREKTFATLSIFTYRRILKICVRLSPKRFADDDGREFLRRYVAQLRSRW